MRLTATTYATLYARSLVPRDNRILRMKCVWKVKSSQEGLAARFKARWVVCGQHMIEGVHFFQSWAPTARATSIKILLTVAGVLGLRLVSFDVVSAFLGIKLREDVFVYPGKGFMHRGKPVPPGFVLKLNKSCYGIKSASRYFWLAMDSHLREIGFTPTSVDPCLYVRRSATGLTILGVIVDDIVCATNEDPLLLLSRLKERFDTTFEGELSYVLGLHVTRNMATGHVFLDQRAYIEKVARAFRMEGSPSARLPHNATKPKLSQEDCVDYAGKKPPFPYRALVGSLLYARITRSDVCQRVSQVGRFSHAPGRPHWDSCLYLLRYLIATKDSRLRLGGLALVLYVYSDADWCGENARQIDQCRSTSAFWAFLADGPVAFYSKLQRVTALSSTESEYKALSKAALLELCKCATQCAPAWSKTPHGLKGFHCAKVFAALETSKPAVNDLRTARALRSRQVSACSAAMSAIAIRSILKDLGFEQSAPHTCSPTARAPMPRPGTRSTRSCAMSTCDTIVCGRQSAMAMCALTLCPALRRLQISARSP